MSIDTRTVETYIKQGESLTIEFKSERNTQLPDRDIYEAIVCMANAEGGVILIGVEDNGDITGPAPVKVLLPILIAYRQLSSITLSRPLTPV